MQLQDGAGKGYWAKIDRYNRINCYSTCLKEISYISVANELAFSITTDSITFNSTNEHPWLYVKNTNSDLYLYFSSIMYSFNGGDTNHNRSMIKRVYRNPDAPTARYTECCNANLNIGSNNTALLTSYTWDGSSGDGMDVDASSLNNVSTSIVSCGTLTLDDLEGVVLPYNSSLLFTYEPEEIGHASISAKIYFNHSNK